MLQLEKILLRPGFLQDFRGGADLALRPVHFRQMINFLHCLEPSPKPSELRLAASVTELLSLDSPAVHKVFATRHLLGEKPESIAKEKGISERDPNRADSRLFLPDFNGLLVDALFRQINHPVLEGCLLKIVNNLAARNVTSFVKILLQDSHRTKLSAGCLVSRGTAQLTARLLNSNIVISSFDSAKQAAEFIEPFVLQVIGTGTVLSSPQTLFGLSEFMQEMLFRESARGFTRYLVTAQVLDQLLSAQQTYKLSELLAAVLKFVGELQDNSAELSVVADSLVKHRRSVGQVPSLKQEIFFKALFWKEAMCLNSPVVHQLLQQLRVGETLFRLFVEHPLFNIYQSLYLGLVKACPSSPHLTDLLVTQPKLPRLLQAKAAAIEPVFVQQIAEVLCLLGIEVETEPREAKPKSAVSVLQLTAFNEEEVEKAFQRAFGKGDQEWSLTGFWRVEPRVASLNQLMGQLD